MPNTPRRKSAFQFPRLWGVAEKKKYAKQSQLECKLPVAFFSRPQQEQRGTFLRRDDSGNNDWTGKRLSQLLLRWQRTTNENERINVLHDSNMEEETREEGAGRAETEVWEGRRLPSSLLCRRQGYCPAE